MYIKNIESRIIQLKYFTRLIYKYFPCKTKLLYSLQGKHKILSKNLNKKRNLYSKHKHASHLLEQVYVVVPNRVDHY